jgi:predicted transposase YdaD
VDSDIPLKVAFRVRTKDLLPLTDDAGAKVVSALAVELSEGRRTVDLVLRLRMGTEEYLRHVEFQSRHRRDLALRCFEYAARLAARFGRPVLTTVMYLRPPAPRELIYRHSLGGTVVNQWRFAVVRLWEQEPRRLLALGPGGASLVPLSGGASLSLVGEASRKIQRDAPAEQRPDLLAVLQVFAEGRYTATQLARVIPERVAMASGLFEKVLLKGRAEGLVEGRTEGLAEGRATGRAEEARQICVKLARTLHPAVANRVVPVIARCSELARLRRWALRAPRVSDVEFVRLVAGRRGALTSRRRAPRPTRRSSRTPKSSRSVR